MTDPSVIAAVAAAVAADPLNAALRAHLCELLLGAGRAAEAFDHARTGLGHAPADIKLLELAAKAGRLSGNEAAANGYQGLLSALTGSKQEATPPNNQTPDDQTPDRAMDDSTFPMPDGPDELLKRWAESDAIREIEIGDLSTPRVRLADVGGMSDVKKRLEISYFGPLRNPELRFAFGKSLRGGLLLWGPPGCGKTYIAKAIAGELGASFYNVGLADVLDMYIGSSEKNLQMIFDIARRNTPCVLFLDELDAIGQKRTQLRTAGIAMRGTVNQLLTELDGVGGNNDGVFVLAATNHPWDIDPALLRPGRFDRSVLVLPPDQEARQVIFELHLRGKPVGDQLDLTKLARATAGYSGADLALIVEQATEVALAESMEAGAIRPIRNKDLEKAASEVKPSIGPWIDAARNFALFNNESGQYDDLLTFIKTHKR